MRDARERLQDILDAIEHIQRYAARGREAFEADELHQNWFVRHLQIIGEAARLLPEEIRSSPTCLRSLFYDLGIFAAVLSLSCYLTAGGRGLPNFSGLIAAFGRTSFS